MISQRPEESHSSSSRQPSGLGVASLISSIGIGVLIALLFVIASLVDLSTPGGMGPDSVESILIGLAMLATLFALLLPLGLGIAGLFQSGKSKTLPILGITISVGVGFITVFLVLLGLALDF